VSLLSQHDDGQVDQAVELALELVETEQDDRPMRQTLALWMQPSFSRRMAFR
jgi:hypothetical protein